MRLCVALFILVFSAPSFAGVSCELSDVMVEAPHHGAIYVHGILAGQPVAWVDICGVTGTVQDCQTAATNRRLAVALAAQSAGKNLLLYFEQINSCTAYQPYIATSLRMLN